MQAGDTTLTFENVAFRYRRGSRQVLSGLTWSAATGHTVLLGPNGAGKTTLLKLAASSLLASAGTVRCSGLDPHRRSERARYRALIGWMPQEVRAIGGLTAAEQVAYMGWLKGMSRGVAWDAAKGVIEQVGLSAVSGELASRLSGGQLRRVGLAQALIGEPRLILLDEPTNGLDPSQRAVFRDLVQALRSQATLITSTHQVDDLSDVFDHVAVLVGGHLRWEGTPSAFLELAPPGAERPGEVAFATLTEREE